MQRKREVLQDRVVRSCGGFGNGTQITGDQSSNTVVLYGNDLSTFPDFLTEIRVPVGTLPSVSGFQVRFSSREFHTPGDSLNALVALNPAARKRSPPDLKPDGILIVNVDEFGKAICTKVQATATHQEQRRPGESCSRRLALQEGLQSANECELKDFSEVFR